MSRVYINIIFIFFLLCIGFVGYIHALPILESQLTSTPFWYKQYLSWKLTDVVSNRHRGRNVAVTSRASSGNSAKNFSVDTFGDQVENSYQDMITSYLKLSNDNTLSNEEKTHYKRKLSSLYELGLKNNLQYHMDKKFTFLSWNNGRFALISNVDTVEWKTGQIITRNLDDIFVGNCLYWSGTELSNRQEKPSWICSTKKEVHLYQWSQSSLTIKTLLTLDKGSIKSIAIASHDVNTVQVISCCREIFSINLNNGSVVARIALKNVIPEKLHTIYSVQNDEDGVIVYGVGKSLYRISLSTEKVEHSTLPDENEITPVHINTRALIFRQDSSFQKEYIFENGKISRTESKDAIEGFATDVFQFQTRFGLSLSTSGIYSNTFSDDKSHSYILQAIIESNRITISSIDQNGNHNTFYNGDFLEKERGNLRGIIASRIGSTLSAILLSDDDSLILLQDGRPIWIREEGLGQLRETKFFKLPSKEATQLGMIQQVLNQLQSLFFTLYNSFNRFIWLPKEYTSNFELINDIHGFNRIIIGVSESGKVFALRSDNGRTLWSFYLSSLRNGRGNIFEIIPNDFRSFYIVNGSSSHILKVDTLLGRILLQERISSDVEKVIPILTNNHQNLLLVDKKKSVYIFPNDPTTRKNIKEYKKDIYFYTAEKSTGIITGYFWQSRKHGSQAVEIWNINLHGPIAALSQVEEAPVYSAYQIGVTSVLQKYINPNLVAIATVRELKTDKVSTFIPHTLDLYILNVVTGNIIHHMTQEFATGPINLIFEDNILIIHYLNEQTKSFIVSVSELYYTGAVKNKRSLLNALLGRSVVKEEFVSSYDQQLPIVTRQNFIMPLGSVSKLGISRTKHGLTKKDFLFGMRNGMVIYYDKSLLDARRPLNPTQDTALDGIIPYSPLLPIADHHISLTFNYSVSHIQDIISSPSDMESTTHILVRGTDLYYIRHAPLSHFDMLGSDFSQFILAATIIGLLIGVQIVKALAQRRKLKTEWE